MWMFHCAVAGSSIICVIFLRGCPLCFVEYVLWFGIWCLSITKVECLVLTVFNCIWNYLNR